MKLSFRRHLGGKLGAQIQQELNLQYVGQLQEYSLKHLQSKFGQKTGVWLYELCRGHCSESINVRTIPKSIGCSKNFNGPTKLITVDQVHYWLTQLAEELVERLTEDMQENFRKAQSIIVHFLSEGMTSSLSRTFPLHLYDVNYIISSSWEAINKGHESIPLGQDRTIPWTTGILNIHLSASKFISTTSEGQTRSLLSFVSSKVSPNVSPSKARKNKKDTPSSSVNTTQTPKKSDITAYFMPSIKRQSDDIELIDSPVVKKPHPSSEGHCEIYNEIVQDPFSSTVCGVCGETMLVLTLEEHMEYHTALSK
jgi:DNA polymerase eta